MPDGEVDAFRFLGADPYVPLSVRTPTIAQRIISASYLERLQSWSVGLRAASVVDGQKHPLESSPKQYPDQLVDAGVVFMEPPVLLDLIPD